MQLVLKIPKVKPPFVGIKFESEREASELNQDLVLNHIKCDFRIELEPIGHLINLRLLSQGCLLARFYADLKYNPENLISFLYLTKDSLNFNFSHLVLDEKGNEKVVKTVSKSKLFVLKLTEVCFIKEVKTLPVQRK